MRPSTSELIFKNAVGSVLVIVGVGVVSVLLTGFSLTNFFGGVVGATIILAFAYGFFFACCGIIAFVGIFSWLLGNLYQYLFEGGTE